MKAYIDIPTKDYNKRKDGDKSITILISDLPPRARDVAGKMMQYDGMLILCKWPEETRYRWRWAYVNRSTRETLYVDGMPPRDGVMLRVKMFRIARSDWANLGID